MTSILNKQTENSSFKFHYQAKSLSISHLIFADDVMLFSHGDQSSIDLLLEGVNKFAAISGLYTNRAKSSCFFSNVDPAICDHVIDSSGFQLGTLPIKYLGLPLITTKLSYRDCTPLIMRLTSKIETWVNALLNQAGRLQLL